LGASDNKAVASIGTLALVVIHHATIIRQVGSLHQ